ncbi:L-Proline/Glycine betaine transporter ProP [hydrothermal vent metagenome]|uniref:L-Proline/Glycine betaine transporter ProP n=1 Tax=hydrothermal vent metagenome TaxID=652676 RepID=A0A3B1DAT8_9ZZZZ
MNLLFVSSNSLTTPLLGARFSVQVIPVVSSILCGLTVFLLFRFLINLFADNQTGDEKWRYDLTRIHELKLISPMFRTIFPLFQVLGRINRNFFKSQLQEVNRQMKAAGISRFWLAEEYIAQMQIVTALLLPVYLYFCLRWMGTVGIVSAIMLFGLTFFILRRQLALRAKKRVNQIKRRLPFLLDLLTLQMEAGATFLGALSEAVLEFKGHPIGEEFGRFLGELNMGKSRLEALEGLRDRLSDDEIGSIIESIIQGETLGTPLSALFRTQSDILRLKRSQRAEAIAGEAGVQMLLPAVLVMMSTVIIILGPFILSFLYSGIY